MRPPPWISSRLVPRTMHRLLCQLARRQAQCRQSADRPCATSRPRHSSAHSCVGALDALGGRSRVVAERRQVRSEGLAFKPATRARLQRTPTLSHSVVLTWTCAGGTRHPCARPSRSLQRRLEHRAAFRRPPWTTCAPSCLCMVCVMCMGARMSVFISLPLRCPLSDLVFSPSSHAMLVGCLTFRSYLVALLHHVLFLAPPPQLLFLRPHCRGWVADPADSVLDREFGDGAHC